MNMVYTNYLTNCPHCITQCKIVDHAIPTQKEKNTFSKAIIAASIHPNTHGWGRGEAWKLLSVKGDNLLLPIMGLGQILERKERIPPASPHRQLSDPQSHVFAPSPACLPRISDA